MNKKIILGTVITISVIIVLFISYMFHRNTNDYNEYFYTDIEYEQAEDYDYVPNGSYVDLIDFNTFSEDEVNIILDACDEYVRLSDIYDGVSIPCSFYDINGNTVTINIVGTDILFDVNLR